MKILMVVHGSYPQDVRVARQARALVEGGWEVDVLATTEGEQPTSETVDRVRVHRVGIEHRRGGGALGVALEYLAFALLATVQATRLTRARRYDVVHVHNPPDFLLVAALVPRLLGARIVLDVHDLAPDMFAMRFDGRRGARVADAALRTIERVALRLADTVITVHEPYRRELLQRGADPETTIVVMNTLDERLLPAGPPASSSGFRTVYHGTVTPHYGVHLLVEAAAALHVDVPDIRVEVYGSGDAVPELQRRAVSLGIGDRVAIDGVALPQDEVLRRVAGASAGVIPNLETRLNRYALSTKLFEYVALRVPVACSGLATLREHFSDDEVVFFRPGDAADLAAALRTIAADPDTAAERAERAAVRARAYAWSDNAARLLAALDRLTAAARQ